MANSNLNIKLNPQIDIEAFKKLLQSMGDISIDIDDAQLEAAIDNAMKSYAEFENKLSEPIEIEIDSSASAKIKQLNDLLDEMDVNIDMGKVESEINDLLNGGVGDLGKAIDDAFDTDTSGANKGIRELAQEFDKAEKETQQLLNTQKSALAQMKLTGQAGGDAFKELEKEIADGEEKLKDFAKAAGKAGDELENTSKKASFTDKMAKVGLVADGIRSVGDSVSALSQPFVDLDTATNKIKTLGGEAKNIAPALREMSLEMSKEYPIGAAALQTATYDALSAGISATKEDISAFMDASTQLAVGGGEEVGNTVNLLSSMINAYGESATKTKNYSDILFTTVNLGKTSVAELSGSLSNVIPTAASYGFALDKVGGSLALMTANGIPTAQATTKLNALLGEIQKPTGELAKVMDKAGLSTEELGKKIKSGDVIGAFKDLDGAFKQSGLNATQAFGSMEAASAFNVLTKDFGNLEKTFKEFDNSTGATEAAYQDMAGSIENRSKLLKSQIETSFIEMADSSGALGEIAIVGGQMFSELSPMITAMSGMKVMFGDSAGAALNFANKIITSMIPSLAAQTGATAAAEGAQTGLNASMLANPAGIVIAGIAAIAAGLYLFLTKTESGRQLWEKFKSGLGDVWQKVKPAFDALIGAGKEILGFLQTLGGFLYEFMITPFEMGAKVIGMAIDWFLKFIGVGKGTSGVVDMLKTAFNKAGEVIKAVSGVIGMLTEKFRNVKTIIGNFVSSVPEMFGLLLEYAKYYLNPVNWVDGDEKYEAVLSKKFSNLMGKIANASKEVAKAGTTAVQNNAKAAVQAVQATAKVQDDNRKSNEEKDKNAADEAKKRNDKALAEYKKMLDAMAESYSISKKRIDQSQRQYEIDAESVRLAQNRTANEYDEIALQKEKIKNIEAQKKAYVEAYSKVATLDAKGELVFSTKVKVADADKSKMRDEWTALNQQLQDDQNKRDAIEVKITANTDKFNKEMSDFAKEKLKYEVEMGIKPASGYLAIMESELNEATKELNAKIAERDALRIKMEINPSVGDAAMMEAINQ